MDKKSIEYFKDLLLEKRQQIMKELGYYKESNEKQVKDSSTGDSTYSTHMADHGTDEREREKSFFYASRENKYLQYLDEALERVEDGTYGICHSCDKDIPKERLEAVPHTKLCVPCKLSEKHE